MQFNVKLEDGQRLAVEKSFWAGTISVKLNNKPIGKVAGRNKGPIKVKMKDGSERSLTFKMTYFDPAPLMWLDGKEILLAPKLEKWQTAIVCLPIVIPFLTGFGAVPGAVAGALAYLNFSVFRKAEWPLPLRWSLIGVAPVVGLALCLGIQFICWNKAHPNQQPKTYTYNPPNVPTEPAWDRNSKPADQVEAQLENGGR